MSAFGVAAEPSPEKLRGGYYTPAPIARFLAAWASQTGPLVLEPSCGDGAVLSALPSSCSPTGVELEPGEARKASAGAPQAKVVCDEFFAWFGEEQHGQWDGVAGNPPFIRFGSWDEDTRERAFAVMRHAGLRPTRLTNAWVPFVVASALALRERGRLALVLPAELLQVNYASHLRAFLVDSFAELTALTFRRLVFDGVLQEVVLLLGVRGRGPAAMRVIEVGDARELPRPGVLESLPRAPALQHDSEKWTKYLLEPRAIHALRAARDDEGLARLGELAEVDVGVVTGRNRFFVLRPSQAHARGLGPHLVPLVSRSAQLRGVRFAENDLAALRAGDAPCTLLALHDGIELSGDAQLAGYVADGEAHGVHRGYKCSIRRSWWAVPSLWSPDAFLLRQIHDHPRIVANLTRATSTDTIHRVRVRNGVAPAKLAAASVNTVTFAFAEVMGRSYGGGVLELEPREAEALPFPRARALTMRDVARVDALLRRGELNAALDHVDAKLLEHVDRSLLAELRGVWQRLRERRHARGRRS